MQPTPAPVPQVLPDILNFIKDAHNQSDPAALECFSRVSWIRTACAPNEMGCVPNEPIFFDPNDVTQGRDPVTGRPITDMSERDRVNSLNTKSCVGLQLYEENIYKETLREDFARERRRQLRVQLVGVLVAG